MCNKFKSLRNVTNILPNQNMIFTTHYEIVRGLNFAPFDYCFFFYKLVSRVCRKADGFMFAARSELLLIKE